jgi:hypothetical protein
VIVWKTIRYGHILEAQELHKRIAAKEIGMHEMTTFVLSLIKGWDFVDDETGQPIPLDGVRQLTLPQYNQLMAEFNASMDGASTDGVKKTNGFNASSSPTGSKKQKRTASRPTFPNG